MNGKPDMHVSFRVFAFAIMSLSLSR